MVSTEVKGVESIEPLRADREAYIEHFRIHGRQQPAKAVALAGKLEKVVDRSAGELRARALFELATLRRLTSRFEEAIDVYQRAAKAAKALDLTDLEFDAWLGIARSHAYGTRNHGAAAQAFRRALESASDEPTRKQRYEMADYAAQLQSGRGELEVALVNAIEANRLAQDDTERFYAQLDAGDVLQRFAQSCDYRKLIDAKTIDDEGDSWGACRRAVGAARSYYEAARNTAERLGWAFLVRQTEGFIDRLGPRLFLINQRAAFEKLGTAQVFKAQEVDDVLVNEEFAAGASELSEYSALAEMIAEVVPDAQTDDPRSLYLRGIRADLQGESERALGYFEGAVTLLERERSSMFDLRRRGTVVEDRPELVRDLALRLLSLGQYDRALQAFESIRARGLGELAEAFEAQDFTDAERRWLAELAQVESEESARVNALVETAIAGIAHSRSVEMLEDLERIRARHRALLQLPEFEATAARLASARHTPPRLEHLQARVRQTRIPVLLYWVTHTNVVVWLVSPKGMTVKTVFLPEPALIDKIAKVTRSITTPDRPYDRTAARELHTYLIAPFADVLEGEQVLIIPQGPLVTLPFEALIDAHTEAFLITQMAVSYAPSVNYAVRSLEAERPAVSAVTAIFDAATIERNTGEIARLRDLDLFELEATPSQDLSPTDALRRLGGSPVVHVLLHGRFDAGEPLQSSLRLNNPKLSRGDNEITAAELLAVDWRDTGLAVFSACEGARMNIRISNEVYGLSWAPLIGGVDHVVMSRWRVQGDSNADWMASFYRDLVAQKASPALAAAVAMRTMIAGEQRDPFYWAGPQVFGR